jgi:hypothetical protein
MITAEQFTKLPQLPGKCCWCLCLVRTPQGWTYEKYTFFTRIQQFDIHDEAKAIVAWSELQTPHLVAQDLKAL